MEASWAAPLAFRGDSYKHVAVLPTVKATGKGMCSVLLFHADEVISFFRSNLAMVVTNRAVHSEAEWKKRGISLIVAFH